MQVIVPSENDLHDAVVAISAFINGPAVILLKGDLGAGKTTFTKAFLSHLGVKDEISSPTYSLINEYELKGQKVFHLDLYRLNGLEEAISIGVEDCLDAGSYCFIEWPELILELLPKDYFRIEIERLENDSRKINIFKGS